MLLTYTELTRMCEDGVIEGVDPAHINGASIDITLGDAFWFERERLPEVDATVDLAGKAVPAMSMKAGSFTLAPGQFCLASSREVFNLPDDIAAMYFLKSSLARAGLDHLKAGWADPGWNGSVLTLEYVNVLRHHSLKLTPGMKAGQMVFFRGEEVPHMASYAIRGQYNGDRSAQPSKGAR